MGVKQGVAWVMMSAWTMYIALGCSSGPGGPCGEDVKAAHSETVCRRGYCARDITDEDGYSICLLYRDVGDSCQESLQCMGEDEQTEAFCDEGTCRPTREAGLACDPSTASYYGPCKNPLWCAPEGVCEAPRELGEPCGVCEEGLRCMDSICKARSQDEACDPVSFCREYQMQCFIQADGIHGVCARYGRGKDHLPCEDGSPCEEGMQCIEGSCVEPSSAEELCVIGDVDACMGEYACRFTASVDLPLTDAQFYDPAYAYGTCQIGQRGEPCDTTHAIQCGSNGRRDLVACMWDMESSSYRCMGLLDDYL